MKITKGKYTYYVCDICREKTRKDLLNETRWGELCSSCHGIRKDLQTMRNHYKKIKVKKGVEPRRLANLRKWKIAQLDIQLDEQKLLV